MRQTRSLPILALLALLARPAAAEKVPADFRAAFEQAFYKGSYAVVMREGVPTTSVYGVDGNSTNAHFSIDVRHGNWRVAEGLLDFDQTAADFLNEGEVMEFGSVAWKDNRVDLRMVSVEAHKVTRGSGFLSSSKREPVATNFKFFFPFVVTGAKDASQALKYVEAYLKPFHSEREARQASVRLLAGGAEPAAPRTRPTASDSASSKKEIKVGMTPLDVIEILGKPQKEVAFQTQSKWTYPDLTVIFENGRVKEVRF